MAEYIDREALLKKAWDADTRIGYVQVVDVGDILDMPAADVASVVRCKDCKFSFYWEKNLACGSKDAMCDFVREDFYCAHGIKKEGKESG